jgi:hypothetical protein
MIDIGIELEKETLNKSEEIIVLERHPNIQWINSDISGGSNSKINQIREEAIDSPTEENIVSNMDIADTVSKKSGDIVTERNVNISPY